MEQTQWQSLLQLGNDCFHDKQWNQAEFFYSEAYDLLAYSYRNDPLSSEILMAWICSCHNLAWLYEAQGNLDLSLKFLLVPHDYLKSIASSKIPNDEVKLIAIKGMALTHPPILLFTQKHPICDDCKSQVETLQQTSVQEEVFMH